MLIPEVVWLTGLVVIVVVAVAVAVILRSRRIDLSAPESTRVQSLRPEESVTAMQADNQQEGLYDYDAGEQLAAPFAEQIEDIVRAKLRADPELARLDIDLGTSPDGGLEIWVDGVCYVDVSTLPNERLRRVFREAIAQWDQREEE